MGRLSRISNTASWVCCIIEVQAISPLLYQQPRSLLSPSSQMAIVYGQAISHIQYCQLGLLHYKGAGYLTSIISTASLPHPSLLPMAIIYEQAISHI